MADKYNIDLAQSYMIGDSTVDIQTGANAKMHTVLVLTGQAGLDRKYPIKADDTAEDVLDAVRQILGK